MGFSDEHARKVVLDLETAPIEGVEAFIEPGEPPANYKSEEAIGRWQADYKASQIAKAALDLDLCRIAALGTQDVDGTQTVWICAEEQDEKTALQTFWQQYPRVTWVGFNCLSFDLPILLRRSLYLGVTAPALVLDKYRHPGVLDVLSVLSNNGAHKLRSLAFYLRRFGLPATEGHGSEIPGLVAAGDWAAVEAHLRADLVATASLARRVGCL